MDQALIQKAKEKIEKIIEKSKVYEDPKHSKLTCKWLLELYPEADEAMQIAALGHDIERGAQTRERSKDYIANYNQEKKDHALRSKAVLVEMLKGLNFDNPFVEKVAHLVENHEVGGDKESDLLKSADSISYFDWNINFYFQRDGESQTRFKIKYMFDRIHDPKVKQIILRLNYSPEIKKLINEELGK